MLKRPSSLDEQPCCGKGRRTGLAADAFPSRMLLPTCIVGVGSGSIIPTSSPPSRGTPLERKQKRGDNPLESDFSQGVGRGRIFSTEPRRPVHRLSAPMENEHKEAGDGGQASSTQLRSPPSSHQSAAGQLRFKTTKAVVVSGNCQPSNLPEPRPH